MQYVGQTTTPFNLRLNKHRSNIKLNNINRAPHVAPHFNQPGHTFSCVLLQHIKFQNKIKLNHAENIWIHKLDSIWPNGLNERNPGSFKNQI